LNDIINNNDSMPLKGDKINKKLIKIKKNVKSNKQKIGYDEN